MIRVFRAAMVVVGVASFLVAELLDGERAREVVVALFPDDAEWQQFMADPEHSFPLLWEQVTD